MTKMASFTGSVVALLAIGGLGCKGQQIAVDNFSGAGGFAQFGEPTCSTAGFPGMAPLPVPAGFGQTSPEFVPQFGTTYSQPVAPPAITRADADRERRPGWRRRCGGPGPGNGPGSHGNCTTWSPTTSA